MQSQPLQVLRTKLDALRQAAESDAVIRQRLTDDPIAFLRSEGLLRDDDANSSATGAPESHSAGAIHMCPWHTCQATRHIIPGPD